MDVKMLITILRDHGGGADELAEAVVGLARGSTGESLTAAFRVVLGTGVLSKARAEQLSAALTRMAAGAQSLEEAQRFSDHPGVAELQREVAELTSQHERLRRERAHVAARQQAVSNLEVDLDAARRKVSALETDLEALRDRAGRLDALCEEGEK